MYLLYFVAFKLYDLPYRISLKNSLQYILSEIKITLAFSECD